MSELASLIREKRVREGLTLRQAGMASGVAFSTLGRIEKGAEPSLKIDRQIRHWLSGETPILPTPPMTLRDWFAGQALAGLLANSGNNPVVAGLARERDVTVDEFIAQMAFNAADAMLSEREKSLSHSEGEEK